MCVLAYLCLCVYGVLGQQGGPLRPRTPFQPGLAGPQPGFPGGGMGSSVTSGVGIPFRGPFMPGNGPFVSGGGPVFGPMGPLRPLSPPLSPMAMMMASLAQNPNNYRYATCNFNDTWSPVKGRMDLRQFLIGEGRQQVQIRIQLSGLPQSVTQVERGIHIHEFGDIGDGCARVGPHYDPNQTPHGSQRNFVYLRHVGDLGNIRQSNTGVVSTQFVDQLISLEGSNNVVGRAFVIKLERDDEGLGGTRESRENGNTHNPLACCTIGRTTARNWYNPMSAVDLQNMASTGMMPYNTRDPFNSNTFVNNGVNTGGFRNTGVNPGFPNIRVNPGFPNTRVNPGFPNTRVNPGFPNTRVNPGFPSTGVNPGFPNTRVNPSFPNTGVNPGFPNTGVNPGFPNTGVNTGFRNTGVNMGFPNTGISPGFTGPGFNSGFPLIGTPQPGFSGPGTTGQLGFGGARVGFGTTGLTQPGFGSGMGFGTGGLTQAGANTPGGLNTQPGQTGLRQIGFGGTGTNPNANPQTFGAGTLMPGSTQGQTFNFAAQGK